jgi:hypothetical protein
MATGVRRDMRRGSGVFLSFEFASESPGAFSKCRLLGPTPRVSKSAGLRWDLRICNSKNFPGNAELLA